MNQLSKELSSIDPQVLENIYLQYKNDPSSVDEKWHIFFAGYDLNKEIETPNLDQETLNNVITNETFNTDTEKLRNTPFSSNKEVGVSKLISAYRTRGHLLAKINPLKENLPEERRDLQPHYFGLEDEDLEKEFTAAKEIGLQKTTLKNIQNQLNKIYCSSIGAEFYHCTDEELRWWIYNFMEKNRPVKEEQKLKYIYEKVSQAVDFENFLHIKYGSQKRFGLEGLESVIAGLGRAIDVFSVFGVQECVVGMAHRGRLNILVNLFEKSFKDLIVEFQGGRLPKEIEGYGDVKYHLGQSADVETLSGNKMHLSMAFNPSHLEFINSVVQGIVYGKCSKYYHKDIKKIVPILIHGDAAVAGQGINYELANFSELEGYHTGGTIHIVLNNQLGFTANDKETRSNLYCTDIAKMTNSPVFHVNSEDVQAVVDVMEFACSIRQKFGKDVWIDLYGYRKNGHNEGDEPRFTQPLLYKKIAKKQNVKEIFQKDCLQQKILTESFFQQTEKQYREYLEKGFEEAKQDSFIRIETLKKHWHGIRSAKEKDFEKSIETGVDRKILDEIFTSISNAPSDFNLFSKVKKLLETRRKSYQNDTVDWAIAEQLAYGSLLKEGRSVRLSGQDSKRGTFSHRHAAIFDNETGEQLVLLNQLNAVKKLRVVNSVLSELSILGFEYGYSLSRPKALAIWEAQFGDFVNCAQVIIDQFISSGETKWQRYSGLIMLLPHGYEGMGPEHSSARLERFLQLCAENNMIITNPTTPANFFHLMRRQVRVSFRKPLIVMTPKSLFRHKKVISKISELEKGCFQEIIEDKEVTASKTRKVIFCTGKIYYDLVEEREEKKIKDVAIFRIEQLYPFPKKQFEKIAKKYKNKEIVWAQEEPKNMGAWFKVKDYLPNETKYIGRKSSSSPATGIAGVHREEQKLILEEVFQ